MIAPVGRSQPGSVHAGTPENTAQLQYINDPAS